MNDVEVNGRLYGIGKLAAFDQFHVFRRVTPILQPVLLMMRSPAGAATGVSKIDMFLAAFEPMSSMSDEQLDYVLQKCLSVVKIKQDDGKYFPLMMRGQLADSTLDMPSLLRLTWEVLIENFQPFFKGLLAGPSKGEAEAPPTS